MTRRNGCKNGLLRDYEFTYLNREMHGVASHPQKGKKLKSSSLSNVFHPCVFVTNLGWCNVDP